ncbi:DUF5615 family PIN-like protein [Haloechinothrix salitolerans]|uniref:DUF5615 family PIN-like protein n=1 Tax=Haloechinothrix salitolerans TaxID=926830 RepID=A0ABW2BY09_9PSEU
MKFLVDTGISTAVCVQLRAASHDAVHIDEFAAGDRYPSVLATAAEHGRVVISRDHTLDIERQTSRYPTPPIVLVQELHEDPNIFATYLSRALKALRDDFVSQATITYIHSEGISYGGIPVFLNSDDGPTP